MKRVLAVLILAGLLSGGLRAMAISLPDIPTSVSSFLGSDVDEVLPVTPILIESAPMLANVLRVEGAIIIVPSPVLKIPLEPPRAA